MASDPLTFGLGVVAAAIPGVVVCAVTWFLTSRTNRSLARYQAQLARESEAMRAWQVKRVDALVEVYSAFRDHFDFLRLHFYWPETGGKDISPLHEFRKRLERVVVYFDEGEASQIRKAEAELLLFWNWAVENQSKPDKLEELRKRLDVEVPKHLEAVRKFVSRQAVRAPA